MNDIFLYALGGLVVAIVVFLIARELLLWYWKINRIVWLLERSNTLLQGITETLGASNSSGWTCSACGASVGRNDRRCPSCHTQLDFGSSAKTGSKKFLSSEDEVSRDKTSTEAVEGSTLKAELSPPAGFAKCGSCGKFTPADAHECQWCQSSVRGIDA